MKKALAHTKCTVKLRRSEYREEWYLTVESYPVFKAGSTKPARVVESLNRVITTPVWDKTTPARGMDSYKPKRDQNGVIQCKSAVDQESCIYADKVRGLRQREYDNASLYTETEAAQAELNEKSALCQLHKQDIAKLRNGYKAEIEKAIRENERLNKTIKDKDAHIAKQNKRIDELKRKANPQRYHLSSGAELVHHFIPNLMYPSLHIWTKVGDEEFDASRSGVSYDLVKQFSEDKITLHELVNEVFEPWEQVSEAQANLLGQAFILACGGEGQARVGTGSGGSQSELPWRDKDKNKNRGARR